MKKIDAGKAIAILANIGALIGIVFVGSELRQANRIARGTTSYELTRNWIDVNDLIITNAEFRNLLVELRDEEFQPESEQDSELANAYARRQLANWIGIQEAYDNGLVARGLYDVAAADVSRVVANRPGVVSQYEDMPSVWLDYEILRPILAALADRRSR